MKRRTFIGTSIAAGAAQSIAHADVGAAARRFWDFIIIGAGTAGLPAAIFAARRGARVVVIDAADKIGGTLHLAGGEISGAGTTAQAANGLVDHPDIHYADVMRLSHGTADPDVSRLAVDNGGETLNWLLAGGLVPLPEHPVTGEGLDDHGYSVPRYLWGKNGGRDLLAVIDRQFTPLVAAARITLLLNSRVAELLTSGAGIGGVRVGSDEIKGRHIILTTGGYAMNPEVFERMIGQPAYAAGSYPQSQGDGLQLATAVGAALRGQALHRPGTGSIMTAEKFPASTYARFNTAPEKRPPWEIWVNNLGQRFIREDTSNAYTLSRALFGQPRLRYAIVFDEAILREAPVGIPGWTADKIRQHCGTHPMFHRADTLDELAAKAGIAAGGLTNSVSAFNDAARSQGGDSFGRVHMPRAIVSPPYYAIIHLGHSATSSTGVVVDRDLRVLSAEQRPIPGLYAAGEVLGSGVTLGNAFVPGMMLTPAMTFGRLLGQRLPLAA